LKARYHREPPLGFGSPASAALKENLDNRIKLKETYYSEKLTILRDIARSKQEIVIYLTYAESEIFSRKS
jgi:hypothetical protein